MNIKKLKMLRDVAVELKKKIVIHDMLPKDVEVGEGDRVFFDGRDHDMGRKGKNSYI